MKVLPRFARVQQSRFALEMALFADAVARARREFRWVNDVFRGWLPDVIVSRSVAAIAANRLQRHAGKAPAIAAQELAIVRVAKETGGIDQPIEVDVRHS